MLSEIWSKEILGQRGWAYDLEWITWRTQWQFNKRKTPLGLYREVRSLWQSVACPWLLLHFWKSQNTKSWMDEKHRICSTHTADWYGALKGNIVPCECMEEPEWQYVLYNKPGTEGGILYEFTYIRNLKKLRWQEKLGWQWAGNGLACWKASNCRVRGTLQNRAPTANGSVFYLESYQT